MALVSWLFLDLNSYFASVEQELHPELRGKPIAVVPLMADTTFCIAASYEAKAFGVKTGTRVDEAKRMCPGLLCIQARHDHYVRYHHQIVEAVESCVPVHAVVSIDEMVCKLTGSQQNTEKAKALALSIKSTIREKVGSTLRCSIGLATNRFLAKVGSDMQKPDGLTVIEQKDLPDLLLTLQTRDFPGIGPQMEKRLQEHEIFTVKQLLDCSEMTMRKIWGGVVGERFWHLLRGEDVEGLETHRRTVGHSHVLPPAERTKEGAFGVAQKLVHKAASRLRRMNYWCSSLALYMKFMNRPKWETHVNFVECQDTLTLLEALQKLWKDIPKTGKPLAVGVTLYNLVPDDLHNFGIFDEEKRTGLAQAMDKLNAKYGKMAVHFGGVTGHAAPTRIAFTNIPELEDFEFDGD
ncbi:MAG: DNA polymerase [Bacteroidetes bacterium]|nr:DNA polymerase [Bacteroidota bacterium]MCW5896858.1 DNA polymerase [Bacteroidota bacterium]